jgi:hypothetical protein
VKHIHLRNANPFLVEQLQDHGANRTLDGEEGEDRLLRELLVTRYHRDGLPGIASMLCWASETIVAFHKATAEDDERLRAAARILRDRDTNNKLPGQS